MSEKRIRFGSTVHVTEAIDGIQSLVHHAVLLRHGIDSTGKYSEVRVEDADGTIIRVKRDNIGECTCG